LGGWGGGSWCVTNSMAEQRFRWLCFEHQQLRLASRGESVRGACLRHGGWPAAMRGGALWRGA